MSTHSAKSAYYALLADIQTVLQPRATRANVLMEIAPWSETEGTINFEKHTFTLRLSNLDRVPMSLPATGSGYQVLSHGSGWMTAQTAKIVYDPATSTTITAPSKIDGTLLVSWKFSWFRWLWAWVFWLCVLCVRVSIVVVIVVVVAVVLYMIPWGELCILAMRGITWVLSLRNTVSIPTFTPTPVPSHGNVMGSRPVVGKPPR